MDHNAPITPIHPFFLGLARVTRIVERVLSVLSGVCFAAFIVTVFVDVLFRQVFLAPLLAPFEISVFCFIWSVFLAGAVATKQQAHFVVDFLPPTMPWFERWLTVFVSLLCLGFSLVVLRYGIPLAEIGLHQFSPMNEYRMAWAMTAVPVAGSAMVLFTFEQLMRALVGQADERPAGVHGHGTTTDA